MTSNELFTDIFTIFAFFSLVFRGGMNEQALICTDDTTYMVKMAETSNVLLLLPELSYPKETSHTGLRAINSIEVNIPSR